MIKKKICLSIETTGAHLGFSLVDFSEEPRLLKHFFKPIKHKQSEEFFSHLTKLMRECRVKKVDLSFIAVDHGPGSFTGVRVGVAAARALSQGLNIPVIGVSSLEALAWQAPFLHEKRKGVLLSSFPALPGEIYFSVYRVSPDDSPRLTELLRPSWSSEAEFKTKTKNLRITAQVEIGDIPHPNSIALIAIEKFLSARKIGKFDFNQLAPLYLQPSWAERKLGSKKK